MGIKHWWFMSLNHFCAVRFIKAEPPCMKGELQVGYWLIGWQK